MKDNIIKHTEYKMTCACGCFQDLTNYIAADRQSVALPKLKKEAILHGAKNHKGEYYTKKCYNNLTIEDPAPKGYGTDRSW